MSDHDGGETLERYSPKHPLPAEIRNMRRDSTVCKYCGVSYLIHNEIKMLEDKLNACEKELTHLRGCEQREAELKQRLDELDGKREKELARRDTILGNMKQELRETQEKLIALDDLKKSIEQKLGAANDTIESLKQIESHRTDVLAMSQDQLREMQKFCEDLKKYILVTVQDTQRDLVDLNTKCVSHFDGYIVDITNERDACLERNTETGKLLKTSQNEAEKLKAEISVVEDRCIQHECKIRNLEQRIREQTDEVNSTVSKNRTLVLEVEEFKQLIKSKSSEVTEMSTAMRVQREEHQESLAKFQETLDKQTAEISQLRQDVTTWSNKYNEQTEASREMQRKHNHSSSEIDDLKMNLLRATQQVESLKHEREMSISAHQTQISELRESFTNKLAEMNLWPERLEKALSERRQKHEEEMDAMRLQYETTKAEEILILRRKHDELIAQYTSEINEKHSKHHADMSELKAKLDSEACRWKKLLDDAKNRFSSTEAALMSEIEGLKGIVRDLESRLAKLGSEKLNGNGIGTEQFATMQTEFLNLKSEYNKVSDELKTTKEEVASLQETVRRECEERFELTESLSAAREELLAAKGISGGRSSVHARVSPPPNNSPRPGSSASNTSGRESEGKPQIHDTPSQHNRTSPGVGVPPNRPHEALSTSDISFTVKNNSKKSPSKMKGNSIAQHRRRIANLLGKQ